MLFVATDISCELMASAGLCHFHVHVFNTFLYGSSEGMRKIYDICECSCRANNEDVYDSGGINSTCANVIPPKEDNVGALDFVMADSNLAASRIRLGSNVDCGVFTDPASQCGMTLHAALGGIPPPNQVRQEVSDGAKDLKVSEWCRELCCGADVTFVEDDGCGECRSESVASLCVRPATPSTVAREVACWTEPWVLAQ